MLTAPPPCRDCPRCDALADAVHRGALTRTGPGQAEAVDRLAAACRTAAAVLLAHYRAAALLGASAGQPLAAELARGRHLTALALADDPAAAAVLPPGAVQRGGVARLTGAKHPVPAAGEADSYLWSAPAVEPGGPPTLWLVPAKAPGLFAVTAGHRLLADPVLVPASSRLNADPLTDLPPWLRLPRDPMTTLSPSIPSHRSR